LDWERVATDTDRNCSTFLRSFQPSSISHSHSPRAHFSLLDIPIPVLVLIRILIQPSPPSLGQFARPRPAPTLLLQCTAHRAPKGVRKVIANWKVGLGRLAIVATILVVSVCSQQGCTTSNRAAVSEELVAGSSQCSPGQRDILGVVESIGLQLIITALGSGENTQDGSFISTGCYATDLSFLGWSLWIQGRPYNIILQLWSYKELWANVL
jgi:hypothetical protein